jgi:hypothetical protein
VGQLGVLEAEVAELDCPIGVQEVQQLRWLGTLADAHLEGEERWSAPAYRCSGRCATTEDGP